MRWREEVAREKRAAFRDETYWGRPVPGFGPGDAAIGVLGLAPAAHGANRTGRVFTGDRSGDWLFASMHRVGLANQPTSTHVGDGLELHGVRVLAAVRCAPPANQPTPAERDACAPWMDRELELLVPTMRVLVCLGGFGWQAGIRALRDLGYDVPGAKFGHAAQVEATHPALPPVVVLGCYHPSQQNTFTGRLTEPMIDAVFARAAEIAAQE